VNFIFSVLASVLERFICSFLFSLAPSWESTCGGQRSNPISHPRNRT